MYMDLFFGGTFLFNAHIFEFARLEHFAALLAFDEFRIFFTSDDLNAQMLTRLHDFSR